MTERLFLLGAKALVLVMLVGHVQCQAHNKMRVTRGSGSMGLIPFPRVGRSGTYDRNFDLNLFDTSDLTNEMKRQNMYAFPRVGRSNWKPDVEQQQQQQQSRLNTAEWAPQKKNIAIATPGDMTKCIDNCAKHHSLGLWWGPRLGRVQKRAAFEIADYPWALVSLRDFHLPNPRETDFTPRLGRESEEESLEENDGAFGSSATHLGRPVQQLQ